jgi:glucose-1-phosphate thymidylyltransferase, short form
MKKRKGIILAGGTATRLFPVTFAVSKQILPIYDKPMIYYPVSTLMMAGIKDILIISTPRDIETFKTQLGDGSKWGMNFEYKIQDKPKGLAEAFIIGEDFIGKDDVAMILGDNMFYGTNFSDIVEKANNNEGSTIFGYLVKDPKAYGVVEFDEAGKAISIEEKPQIPKSNYAVPGLYFYSNDVVNIAKNVKPSARGELEITAINEEYMNRGNLKVERLGRSMAWLDTGTYDGLLEASNFVATVQKRQGLYVSCPEEIAFKKGFINKEQLLNLAEELIKTDYGQYLKDVADSSYDIGF